MVRINPTSGMCQHLTSTRTRHALNLPGGMCTCSVPRRLTPSRRGRGIGLVSGMAAFETLGTSLTPVRTPIGAAWILSQDEPLFRSAPGSVAPARLLPSGDTWFLLQGSDCNDTVTNE